MSDHNHQKLHDPRYIGPGIWFTIHVGAATAKTKQQQLSFIQQLRTLQTRFPCLKCKNHFQEYLEKHPPENVAGISDEAVFRWTVDFHNVVNAFTAKSQVAYVEAHNIYYVPDSIICTADCTDTGDIESAKLVQPTIIHSIQSNGLGYTLIPTSQKRHQ